MSNELLKAFDADGSYKGTYSRDEVHEKGFWHETFHCWFICKENDKHYILFQLRSNQKKDYPNKLDITAAGHLSADERVSDGIREVHEELDVKIALSALISIGTIPDQIIQKDIIDREFAHVFVYIIPDGVHHEYEFQTEEVSGIMKVELDAFEQLWLNHKDYVLAQGILLDGDLKKVSVEKTYCKEDFVPHENSYILEVLRKFKDVLKQ